MLSPSAVIAARTAWVGRFADGDESMGGDGAESDQWLSWRKQRHAQQMTVLERCDFAHTEPLVMLHCAMLRVVAPASHAEQHCATVGRGRRPQRL